MKSSFRLLFFIKTILLSNFILAEEFPCGIHNQMILNTSSGTWNTQAYHLNEFGEILLLKSDCKPINERQPGSDPAQKAQIVNAVDVTPGTPLTLGHKLGATEDFYTSLLFSMVKISDENEQPLDRLVKMNTSNPVDLSTPSKTCLFYVAAKGIAQPVTNVIQLNGANCKVKNDIVNRTYNFYAE